MFFSCTTCGTRLQLPDEQVVNRILKVRCTACSAVMTVRESTTGKHERPVGEAWFVAVNAQQRGPITIAELRGLARDGRVTDQSYAWTAGMPKWMRAGEIPALASVFSAAPSSSELSVTASDPPAAEPRTARPRQTVMAMRALAPGPEPMLPSQAPIVTAIPDAPVEASGQPDSARPSGEASVPAPEPAPPPVPAPAPVPEVETLNYDLESAPLFELSSAITAVPRPALAPTAEADALFRSLQEQAAQAEAEVWAKLGIAAPTSPPAAPAPQPEPPGLPELPQRFERSPAAPPEVVRAELAALQQEMSLHRGIETSKKKRWLWIALGILAIVAIIVVILLSGPRTEHTIAADVVQTKKPYEAAVRREASPAPAPAPPSPSLNEEHTPEPAPAPAPELKPAANGTPKGPGEEKVTLVVPGVDPAAKKLDPVGVLGEDEVGKQETKIDFDPGDAARKAAAEDQQKTAAEALGEEVAAAFGKKKAQFAKCSDDEQQRVRVVFTVTPDGTTTGTLIGGATDAKARCIKAILDRSVFPAGKANATYSQTLVL